MKELKQTNSFSEDSVILILEAPDEFSRLIGMILGRLTDLPSRISMAGSYRKQLKGTEAIQNWSKVRDHTGPSPGRHGCNSILIAMKHWG
jgi:hypothetical protein